MPSRAEHRRSTLRTLSDAAIESMEEFGPDVSLEVIAERAGVTRRTIYRWVATRDDLVFIHPRLWLDHFDDAVEEVAHLPLRPRLLHGAERVCRIIDDDPRPVLRAMRLARAHPHLMRGYATVNHDWVDRFSVEVRANDPSPTTDFRSQVVGAAVMGAIDAALSEWSATSPTPLLWRLVQDGLGYLDPILDGL